METEKSDSTREETEKRVKESIFISGIPARGRLTISYMGKKIVERCGNNEIERL